MPSNTATSSTDNNASQSDNHRDFRAETRAWLEANCPESQRQPPVEGEGIWGGRNPEFANSDCQQWFERMRDKGWTVPNWPVEYGGAGLSPLEHQILKEEMRRLRCRTPLNDLGILMFGPALMEYGSEQQKSEHLPKIARGEIRWCQGYSEPGAGSDLANIQTKAEDKGDHFLVNGSKIWTSYADKSDWMFCLTRTDSSAKKQQGISFLLIDMDDPGITAKPIELISGNRHFCQVWLDNVKVPKANLVHKLNEGWTVGKAVLQHERKSMSETSESSSSGDLTAERLLDFYLERSTEQGREGQIENAELRTALTNHQMNMRMAKLCQQRIYEEYMAGTPSGLAMIMKYIGTEELKRKDELILAAMGNRGMAWEGEGFTEDELLIPRNWAMDKAYTIAGGSSEVQLNILAKNVLGLPD